jgi:hypothetical protein
MQTIYDILPMIEGALLEDQKYTEADNGAFYLWGTA